MKKTYVLDTNVLLGDPNALHSFEENDLVIPLVVLEELDRQKNRQDDVGACARQVNRTLDDMRKSGNLMEGVETLGGGTLRVESINDLHLETLPKDLDPTKVDNKLIAFMLSIKSRMNAILISRDINVRIKCDALGVACEDYRKIKVATSTQEFYRGVSVHETELEYVDEFFANGGIVPKPEWSKQLFPNQIVIIKNVMLDGRTVKSAVTRFVVEGGSPILKPVKKLEKCFGLSPRNKEQNFSLDILLDPMIKLVTLTGPAGCVDPKTSVKIRLAHLNWQLPVPDDTYRNADSEDE